MQLCLSSASKHYLTNFFTFSRYIPIFDDRFIHIQLFLPSALQKRVRLSLQAYSWTCGILEKKIKCLSCVILCLIPLTRFSCWQISNESYTTFRKIAVSIYARYKITHLNCYSVSWMVSQQRHDNPCLASLGISKFLYYVLLMKDLTIISLSEITRF